MEGYETTSQNQQIVTVIERMMKKEAEALNRKVLA
jgi:hypothetical protein